MKDLCAECEYATTTADNLSRHKKSKHEGIRYFCDVCEFTFTNASNLRRHKKENTKEYGFLVMSAHFLQQQLAILKVTIQLQH